MQLIPRNMALVSVALTTCNGERFLRQQLDSIYAQSWPKIEVIAADDCSTDGTVAILEEYRQRFGMDYSINERNLGFVRNFEHVLSRCSGEYIALADQDDVWQPEKLTTLVNSLGEASLIYSDARLIDEQGKELPGSLLAVSGVLPMEGKPFEYLVCNSCVTGCTALFRRELLSLALPIPVYETYHDWWLALAASRRGGIRCIDSCLTNYRQHGANDTGATRKTFLLSRISARFSPHVTQAKQRYYQLLLNRANGYRFSEKPLELTPAESAFLEDIGRYAAGRLGHAGRFETLRLALRHRAHLFPGATLPELCAYLASTMTI